MRSSILTIALAAVPCLVSGAGTLGFALGNKKTDGTCKDAADYTADLKAIGAGSSARVVRSYASDECNSAQGLLPAAKTAGFKVILGIWYVCSCKKSDWELIYIGSQMTKTMSRSTPTQQPW